MPDTAKVVIRRNPFGRAAAVWDRYERGQFNYAKLWMIAQAEAPREPTVDVARLQWLKIFEKNAALSWIGGYGAFNNDDRLAFCKLVFDVLDPYLASYFGCEYMPLFLRFYANKPGDKRPYAANWHCDAGPRKHLKLLLYLNDSDESGGNTEFLDHDTTMRLDETGYLFCPLDNRTDDLTTICFENGIPYQPLWHPIKAGEGVLFEPSAVMHRAVWPTKAPRYMAQICILPSPVPWYAACNQFGMPFKDNGWRPFEVG